MKFLRNILDDIQVSKDTTHIVDVMSEISGKKKIILKDTMNLSYLIIAKDVDAEIDVVVDSVGSECQVFGLFVSHGTPSKIKLTVHNQKSHTTSRVHLISLLYDDAKIDLDGAIDIKKGLKNVVGHLLEENIILGENISVKTLPILSVSSKDVQSSHGAKVEKISPNTLFYMSSKGLQESDAQELVVNGYVDSMFANFEELSESEENEIRKFLV